jgi:hypothetical protein
MSGVFRAGGTFNHASIESSSVHIFGHWQIHGVLLRGTCVRCVACRMSAFAVMAFFILRRDRLAVVAAVIASLAGVADAPGVRTFFLAAHVRSPSILRCSGSKKGAEPGRSRRLAFVTVPLAVLALIPSSLRGAHARVLLLINDP